MAKDYTTYTAEELLNDDYFLASEQNLSDEDAAFWKRQEEKDPVFAAEITLARRMLRDLRTGMPAEVLSLEERSELWERIEEVNRATDRERGKSVFLYRFAAVAASVGLLLIAGWYLMLNRADEPDYLALLDQIEQEITFSSEVALVQGDGKVVILNGNKPHLDVRAGLPDGENVLFVPAGKQASVEFPDHTRMEVNAGTKVIFASRFSSDHREVFVEGEVFMSVSRDEKRPFSVKMRQMKVTVLGTEFNISSYGEDPDVQVVLVKGSVSVDVEGEKQPYLLKPDQMLCLDKRSEKASVDDVNASDYIVWKDGYYLFNQVELGIVLRKLERYFGKPIRWDDEVNTYRCSGKLDLKRSLEDVLTMLGHLVPINIEDRGDSIQIGVQY